MADRIITFKEFCNVCEQIQELSKFADKQTILLNFINKYKELDGSVTSFYPALRLLVPEYERERSPYGLKETSFSKLYVRTLCLQGSDKQSLLNYNRVSTKSSSDFADVAYWVLRKWCPNSSSLTIADVNRHLDEMAQQHANHQPRQVENELNKMIKSSTALEQKWMIRVILKNMRLGLGNDRILKIFHPDAPDLFDVCSSLSKICTTLKDPSVRLHELEIEMFTPFRPMLSLQCDTEVLNKTVQDGKLFYVENKFDGERFQLHMQSGQFKYFSKNGYDYSTTFGLNYISSGLISPHLKDTFSHIDSVILDGEMMGWNTKTNSFGSKGMSFDVKNLRNDSVHRPCFCVFDILFHNGVTLTNKPLSKRLEILDDLFEPIKGVILKSSRLEVKSKNDLMQELNKSVDRQEEGICFKDPNSVYKPNNRKGGWWKMKLEYFEGLMTELDVLIIGGYFGEGKRKGMISSFLLGVAATPKNAGESPTEFHTFAKVATGFSVKELDKLLNELNPFWEPFETNQNPEGILWKKEKPDCWIEPRKSCILQVKASELAKTNEFHTEYTLRFPRVEKIRYDKPWYNCLSVSDLSDLTRNNKVIEKLSGRHLTENDIEVSAKRARKENTSLFHLLDVVQKSDLLRGKEFCVYTGNEQNTKENIEIKIKEFGGRVVQFSGPNTTCTLVGNITAKVKSLLANSCSDIVKLDWIIKVFNSPVNSFINFTPEDMLSTSAKTRIMFSNRFDKFGDSFVEPSSKESLENIINNTDEYMNLLPDEYIDFDREMSFENPLGLFRSCFVYFESLSDDILSLEFEFYGGTKCKQIEEYTTHIVLKKRTDSSVKEFKNRFKFAKIVNDGWIEKCLESKEIVCEENFLY